MAALLVLVLLLRYLGEYPAGAPRTLPLQLTMAAGVLLYAAALALRARRGLALLAACAAVLAIELAAPRSASASP